MNASPSGSRRCLARPSPATRNLPPSTRRLPHHTHWRIKRCVRSGGQWLQRRQIEKSSMHRKIAIIGDRFMLPQVFRGEIEKACGNSLEIRTLETAWPDEPMEFGNPALGLDKIKEYFGQPDEMVDFIGDAEILVTQLAPLSEGMMQRLPALKLVAVSRGGPINIDMAAARTHGITVVNVPGRNATAVAEFTIGAILAETRLIR